MVLRLNFPSARSRISPSSPSPLAFLARLALADISSSDPTGPVSITSRGRQAAMRAVRVRAGSDSDGDLTGLERSCGLRAPPGPIPDPDTPREKRDTDRRQRGEEKGEE